MSQLIELLSHFDILLFLTAIAFCVVATTGTLAIPKILPTVTLVFWQRLIFGILCLTFLAFALIPLLPTKIIFARKLLATYDSGMLAATATTPPKVQDLPEIPFGKTGLIFVTVRGHALSPNNGGRWNGSFFQISLKIDDDDIASASSAYPYSGIADVDPLISTSALLTAGQHKLQIVIVNSKNVDVKGIQLRYQLLELD